MERCEKVAGVAAEQAGELSGGERKIAGLSMTGLWHLLVVYIVWSTTYLAIRVAVAEGGGFPPFSMGASRTFVAGFLLLGLAGLRRNSLRITRQEFSGLVITGTLLWVGGNGLVMWAEQYAGSGFTALVIASTPLWVTFINAIWFKTKPSLLLIGSLMIGFLGLIVLLIPGWKSGGGTDLCAGVAILGGTVSWALGSIYQNRNPFQLPILVISGYQHLIASVGFLLASLALGEPVPQPSQQAWLAWGYLVVFGSIFAFTSFTLTLRLLPINISMTYSYVNPVLALFFGWLLLGEQITVWTLVGALLVIGSVLLLFKERTQNKD
jgi:drug/metabolite transporter (DMT)-like permease